jgi:FlaG/FlaF family flagellin (archaellin)
MINRWVHVALAGVLAATISTAAFADNETASAPAPVQEKTKAEKDAEKKAADELRKKNYEAYKAAAKAAKDKAEAEKDAAKKK